MRPISWLAWGRPARGGRIEAAALELLLGVVDVDGGGEQGDVGVAGRDVAVRGDEAVEPAGVGRAGDHLRAVEQVEQEGLVRRPPRTTTVVSARARRNRARASARSRPQATTLAINESYSSGITSPSATPVSTRTPGPEGSVSSSTVPGAGAKSRSGSSALSRASIAWPDGGGGSPSRRPPPATWSCSFTRSSPVVISVTGCSSLEARGHLEKREGLLVGLVEELDGCRRCDSRPTGPV